MNRLNSIIPAAVFRWLMLLSAFAVLFLLPASSVFAAVPARINYQGRLKENGLPVNGNRQIEFGIFNDPTGGTELYTQNEPSVLVSSGLFNVVLTPGAEVDWRSQNALYLRISVGPVGGALSVMSPREQLNASPYAMYATSAAYAFNSTGWSQTGSSIYNTSQDYYVGIGTVPFHGKLTISNKDDHIVIISTVADPNNRVWSIKADKHTDSNRNRFELIAANDAWTSWAAALQIFRESNSTDIWISTIAFPNGKIGIGNDNPREKLEVSGSILVSDSLKLDGTDLKRASTANSHTKWITVMGGSDELAGAYFQLAGSNQTEVGAVAYGGAQLMLSSYTPQVSEFKVRVRQDLDRVPILIVKANGRVGINTYDPYDALDLSTGAVRFYDGFSAVKTTYTTIFGNNNGINIYTSKLEDSSSDGYLRVGEIWGGMGLFSGDQSSAGNGYNLGLVAPADKVVGLAPNGGNPFSGEGVYVSSNTSAYARGVTLAVGSTANSANLYVVGTSTITSNTHIGGNLTVAGSIIGTGGGMLTGTGVANKISMFSGASTLVVSTISESASHQIGIRNADPKYDIDLLGNMAMNNLKLYNGDVNNTQSYDKINIAGGRNYRDGAMLELGGDTENLSDVRYGSAQIMISSITSPTTWMPMFRVRRRDGSQDLLVVKADGRTGILASDPQAMLHLSSSTAAADQYMLLISTSTGMDGYAFVMKANGTLNMRGELGGYQYGLNYPVWLISPTFGGSVANSGIGFGDGTATADTALWRAGPGHLRTSSMILSRNVENSALYLYGGTISTMSAQVELHARTDAQPGHIRIGMPDGATSQGLDFNRIDYNNAFTKLITISTSGAMYFSEPTSITEGKIYASTVTIMGDLKIGGSGNIYDVYGTTKIVINSSGDTVLNDTVTFSGPIRIGNATDNPVGSTGLVYYNTNDKRLYLYNGTWVAISSGSSSVGGGGSTNMVAKWTGSSTLGNSTITDDGTDLSITGDLKLGGNDLKSSDNMQKLTFSNGTGADHYTQLMSSTSARGGWIKLYGDDNTDNRSGIDLVVATFSATAGVDGKVRFVHTYNNNASWFQFASMYSNGGFSLGIPGGDWDATGPGNGVIRLYGQHRIEGTDNVGPTDILGGNTHASGAYISLFGADAASSVNDGCAGIVMPSGGKLRIQHYDGASTYTSRMITYANGGVRVGSTDTDPLAGSLAADYGLTSATAAFSTWMKTPTITAPAGSYQVAFSTPVGIVNLANSSNILAPAEGMLYYDNSNAAGSEYKTLWLYNGEWVRISTGVNYGNTVERAKYLGTSDWITDTNNDGTINITYGVAAATGVFSGVGGYSVTATSGVYVGGSLYVAGATKSGATIIVAASNSSSATWRADYRCDGTADQSEINTAISNMAVAGGTIVLLEGTYNISASINVSNPNITIRGMGKGTSLVASGGDGFSVTAAGVQIENLSIANTGGRCVYFNGTSSSTVRDCFLRTAGNVTVEIAAGSENCSVESNRINTGNSTGILSPGSNCRIIGNQIKGGNPGINASGNYIMVANNTVMNSAGTGINITGGSYSTVTGNIVLDNAACGIIVNATYVTIMANTSKGNGSDAIKLDTGQSYAAVSGNTIYGGGTRNYNGFVVFGDYNTITTNNIYNCASGIYLGDYSGNHADNNTVFGNTVNSSDYGVYMAGTAANNIVNNNDFSGCLTGSFNGTGTGTFFGPGNRAYNNGNWTGLYPSSNTTRYINNDDTNFSVGVTSNLAVAGYVKPGNLSVNPPGNLGSIYYNTGTNRLRLYDATGWVEISTGVNYGTSVERATYLGASNWIQDTGNDGTIDVTYGVKSATGVFSYYVKATTGIFTNNGSIDYSILTSSSIYIGGAGKLSFREGSVTRPMIDMGVDATNSKWIGYDPDWYFALTGDVGFKWYKSSGIGWGTQIGQLTDTGFLVGRVAASNGTVLVSKDNVRGYYESEANPRWSLDRDMGGSALAGIGLGSGGANALDAKIWRTNAKEITTDSTLISNYGIRAATAVFTGNVSVAGTLDASVDHALYLGQTHGITDSGNEGSLDVTYGVNAGSAAFTYGIKASTGIFTGLGGYSITTSSGISVTGNLYVSGSMKSGATKIISAIDSIDRVVRADYLCDGANDQTEINNAITALAATGGTVLLMEGTYTLSGAITLNQANVTLRGIGKGSVLNCGSGNAVAITANGCRVENLSINNTSGRAVYFNAVSSATVKDCYLRTTAAGVDSVHVDANSENCTVENNRITGAASGGVTIYLIGSNCKALGNTVSYGGIGIQSSGGNAVIADNTVQGQNSHGIYVSAGNYSMISGNNIQNNGGSGININTSQITITGNMLINNTADNLKLDTGASYCVINGNYINAGSTSRQGLTIFGSNNTVTGNLIYNCATAIYMGYSTNHADNNNISGNALFSCTNGFYLSSYACNNILSGNDMSSCTNAFSGGGTGVGTFFGAGNRGVSTSGQWTGLFPSSNTARYIYDYSDPANPATAIAGDLMVAGNDIKGSDAVTRITMAAGSPQITLTGDVSISGTLSATADHANFLGTSHEIKDTSNDGTLDVTYGINAASSVYTYGVKAGTGVYTYNVTSPTGTFTTFVNTPLVQRIVDNSTVKIIGGTSADTAGSVEVYGPTGGNGKIKLILGANTGGDEGLYIQRARDWSTILTVTTTGSIVMGVASDIDNRSPGLVNLLNDDFTFGGRYLNHYGFGFHAYNDGTYSGVNSYISGYPGVNLFAGGINRLRINQGGNIIFGYSNNNIYSSTYTYSTGDLRLGGDLTVVGNDIKDSAGTTRVSFSNATYPVNITGVTQVSSFLVIPEAANVDNGSPAITTTLNDDFSYGGVYLNHYGFGFHSYNDGSGAARNAYMGSYGGMNFFTNFANRLRINSSGNIFFGWDNGNKASTYTYTNGNLSLAGNLTTGGTVYYEDLYFGKKVTGMLNTNVTKIMRNVNDSTLEIGSGMDYDQGGCIKMISANSAADGSFEFFMRGAGKTTFFNTNGWGVTARLWSGGGVRVGSTDTDPGANNLYVDNDVYVGGMETDGAGTPVGIDTGNKLVKTSSSRRYKDNINTYKTDFQKILSLSPKSFVYRSSKSKDIGYIAEDLDEAGLKELVIYNKEKQPDAIKYDRISLYIVEVLKQQQETIAELEKKNKDLESRLKALERRVK